MVSYESVRVKYGQLFASMKIVKLQKQSEQMANIIIANKARYESVSSVTGVPWYVIGFIHSLEAAGNFNKHLHNGDPLTGRTYQVPKGRPVKGSPPFKWEESAVDAITYDQLDKWKDWSITAILWKLESFNGFGYHQSSININSPYLWSGSQHYTIGKYYTDGKYKASLVSQQPGVAILLKILMDKGAIAVNSSGVTSGGGGTNIGNMGSNYGLGCVDSGAGGTKTLVGVHNPSSPGEALAAALGINASDRQHLYDFSATIDVVSAPRVLSLSAQQTFRVKNLIPTANDLVLTCEQVTFFLGDVLEAQITAYAPDPNAPEPQIFLHSSNNSSQPTTTATSQNIPAGSIQERIFKAAIATKGESSRSGPGGGNVACAWCINKLVLPKAGIAPIGANQDLVSSVEDALKSGRGQLVSPRTAGKPGDIVIMGSAHIGICIADGCSQVLSNSSSKATFTWVASIQSYDSYYNTQSRVYQVTS